MIEVRVENLRGKTFKGIFDTEQLADAWIELQKSKGSWGKLDRWKTFYNITPEGVQELDPEEGYTEERDRTIEATDEQGEIVNYTIKEYFYPQEFTVQKTDITDQEQERKGIERRKKMIEVGKEVIATHLYALQQRSLTDEESLSALANFADIKQFLDTGDLKVAKNLVLLKDLDDRTLTQNDKDKIVEIIDNFLNG